MLNRPLDLDAVQTFVRIAEYGSFTRAAEATRTTQSAVSLKLKRLEERVGCKLVERTPRHVQLSAKGHAFLVHAQSLLEAQERAFTVFDGKRRHLSLGISDHVAGPDLPELVARMHRQDPKLVIEIQIATSGDLLKSYDRRELDAVLLRHDSSREDGKIIAHEKYAWFAATDWSPRVGEPLPLATMPEPCSVRHVAGQLLDEAGLAWKETFIGGGIAAVSAAVIAGLGVGALAKRMLPLGAIDVGQRLNLPELPRLPIVLHSRVSDEYSLRAIDALTAAFKTAAHD